MKLLVEVPLARPPRLAQPSSKESASHSIDITSTRIACINGVRRFSLEIRLDGGIFCSPSYNPARRRRRHIDDARRIDTRARAKAAKRWLVRHHATPASCLRQFLSQKRRIMLVCPMAINAAKLEVPASI
jgi:hypothetical protein